MEWEKKWKIMMFIVATNVVASQLPKCQPTRTLTTRAKNFVIRDLSLIDRYSYPKKLSGV